ncbi:MAG: hypothetical protein IT330_03660 [Anaerolineae bacterium]|nr:hypothetical protein [Anaerolineae bacterium]
MMRRTLPLIGILLLVFSLFPASSAPPVDAAADVSPRYDILLILRVAPFAETNRADLVPRAAETAEEANNIFRTLQPRLRDLQAVGDIESFNRLPDAHAIRVRGASAETLDALREMDGVLEVQPATRQILSCARRAVAGFAAAEEMRQRTNLSTAPAATDATNPTIFVNLRYGFILGSTDPSVPVTVTIKSSRGVVKGTRSTSSYGNGSYYSYDFMSCTSLVPGDTVEVRAGASRVASTVVVPITGEITPSADTVFGNTAASRSVDLKLRQEQNTCSTVETIRAVTSNTSGAYTANFAGTVDVKRYAGAEIWVYDGNRNATLLPISAPHIGVSTYGSVDVTLRPDRTITATLRSGSTVIGTETEMADHWGNAFFSFSLDPVPGNTIQVTDGGMTIVYQMVPFNLTGVNLGADQFNLQTAGNRRVRVSTRTLSSRFCTNDSDCRIVTSDGAGNVNVNLGGNLDLGRGDEIGATIYDAEGNWQEGERHPGYVEIARQKKFVSGFWEQTQTNLNILLRNSVGAVKATKTTNSSEGDGSFSVFFSAGDVLAIDDRIEVGSGVMTYTVPIANLTVFANEVTDFVSGQVPNNAPLVVESPTGCWQGNASGTTYNTKLKNTANQDVNLVAGDGVSTYYTDNNGHRNVVNTHVPQISATIGAGNVNGYIREALMPVTVTLRSQGGSIKATKSTFSIPTDYYAVSFSGVTVAVSDKIEVLPQGGSAFSLTVPNLTVLLDPPGNRVYGQTLPNTSVQVALSEGFSFLGIKDATSDGAGNYSTSFAGLLTFNCQTVQVGPCSKATAIIQTSEGHEVIRPSAPPPDVTPDAYEQDDSKATAKAYTGLQHHTFDTASFSDHDWVQFTVGAADVGKLYVIETLNNGPLGDTILTLYDTDGFTELVTAGDYGDPLAAQIRWRFEGAGTYYLQMTPGAFFGPTASCGATYDLFISNRHVFMPLVLKNG